MSGISSPVDFSKELDRTRLKGKTALITGGASGIGAGLVKVLAEAGCFVAIADLNADLGEEYSNNLSNAGHKVIFVQTDVTSWESQVAAFKKTIESSPNNRLDIVVACAGIAGPSMLQDSPFTDLDADEPQRPDFNIKILRVNLEGVMYTATLAAYYWKKLPWTEQDDNVLILISSNIAYYAIPGFTGYTASKWGVRGFFKALRTVPQFKDLFRTNMLAPHITRTPMVVSLQPILDAEGLKFTEVSDCVNCLMRFCCDGDIRGRAVQVNPAGSCFDLCDDIEGGEGSKVFHEHNDKETKDLFAFMEGPLLSMS